MRALTSCCAAALAVCFARGARAEQVVQIPIDALLDGRPVTTLTNGALVSWTVGIDKDDGFITAAAAAFLKQTVTALPDDGSFAMNADHPQMVLHFSNAASATSQQAHAVADVASFEFAVPHASYSQLYLAITSSYGDAPLSVTFKYTDASSGAVSFTLPDWGTGKPLPTAPPIFFNLISGLHKWDKTNAAVDAPAHSLTGVKLSPSAAKQLSSVQISKTTATPYVVFWGATGIATSTLESGGAAGAGGSGGAAGSAGTGAGGSAGTAGNGGTAGDTATAGSGAAAGLGGALGGASGMAAASGAPASGGQGGALSSAAGAPASNASADSSSGCSVTRAGTQPRAPNAPWLLALLLLLRRRARLSSRR